ncbi:MAG: prepilin peptidase [Alphaproteobacteria bacterium]|nr:prepilin peptidase [Alphaproteobacteria bacterium]
MMSFFLLIILAYSFVILAVLFHIDLKERILPNRYVLQYFFAGFAFHIVSGFNLNSFPDIIIAAFCSIALLSVIRAIGNKLYHTDTLGMGDIKLIGAASIWLGSDYIFLAITLGALAGVFHGLGIVIYRRFKAKEIISLGGFSLPAGPGFIIGIIICTILKFHTFI